MSLSVCCLTGAPARPVIAALSPLRGIASEIVLAVDARVGRRTLVEYAAFADRVVPVEYEPPFERYLACLHGLCRGDWVLRLDADEVPSRSLIAALPGLVARRDVLQYYLPTRWVFPRADRWLDEWPWSPDHHNRLVRRDPLLWFSGRLHSEAAAVFPSEYVEAPLYHLDTVLSDRRARLAKVAAYQSLPPSLRASAADGSTEEIYLPEDFATLPPAEVPAEDRDLIDAVLRATRARAAPRPTRRAVPERTVRRADVDRTWAQRPLPPAAYVADLAPADAHRRLVAGEHRPFRVQVTNRGAELWPGGEREPLIRIAYRWCDAAGAALPGEGFRTALPAALGPGATCVVSAIVAAPATAGDYLLELDLVHELVRWFGSPLRLPMRVEAALG
ncbi:MAG TPA: hypothetical protein VGS57_05715 [Thermoanaerobaculia bacterium]|jgi:hypothetical protein|nr:hypothetical protein [Thermoanaerobaculia bacterium]